MSRTAAPTSLGSSPFCHSRSGKDRDDRRNRRQKPLSVVRLAPRSAAGKRPEALKANPIAGRAWNARNPASPQQRLGRPDPVTGTSTAIMPPVTSSPRTRHRSGSWRYDCQTVALQLRILAVCQRHGHRPSTPSAACCIGIKVWSAEPSFTPPKCTSSPVSYFSARRIWGSTNHNCSRAQSSPAARPADQAAGQDMFHEWRSVLGKPVECRNTPRRIMQNLAWAKPAAAPSVACTEGQRGTSALRCYLCKRKRKQFMSFLSRQPRRRFWSRFGNGLSSARGSSAPHLPGGPCGLRNAAHR